ncbi:uncharacterized protein LOC110727671 [Chenopodium quinoa]|uniref:uncharacterized protein LOC110727671 n=1 Tax=Chenopodium quinoa TaxID=63459 RepID=UPI000B78AFE6|nr:uncharacterized protein LOC110727671 [Chenopodium quinoa]
MSLPPPTPIQLRIPPENILCGSLPTEKPYLYILKMEVEIHSWAVSGTDGDLEVTMEGTGNKEFLSVLREIVRINKPIVLALVETHMGGDHADRVATILGYNGHTRVDAQGFSGGIWVYWKPELVTVDPIEQANQYITMQITKVGEEPWYFSAIYTSPDPSKRTELWDAPLDFANRNNKPWFLAGDFNETRFGWERNSSCPDTSRRSHKFNAWVHENNLIEIEFSGPAHTWARGNSVETRSARLDCALCSGEWRMRLDKAQVRHLPALQSDHCPLFISPNGFAPLEAINRPFRFQDAWLTHENFGEFIHKKWDKSAPLMPLLNSLSLELQNWNKEIFHNIFREKRSLIARIDGVQKKLAFERNSGLIKLESKLRRELDTVLNQEELL